MTDHAMRLITGAWAARAVSAAVHLHLFDALRHQPQSGTDLARTLQLDPRIVPRLLRVLATLQLVSAHPDDRWEVTEAGAVLAHTHPRSVAPLVALYEEDYFRDAWDQLESGLRTGTTPFVVAHGAPIFAYLDDHPEAAKRYTTAMTAGSRFSAELADAVQLANSGCIVDVGGGEGSVLAALLNHRPQARGVLLDRPDVVAQAHAVLTAAGVADRATVIGGDMFTDVPTGGTTYLLSRVLHNWNDAECAQLLASIRAVAHPGAQVLIVERLIPTDQSDLLPVLFDLHMFVMTRGRERTEAAYRELLHDAGFTSHPVRALPHAFSVLAATPRGSVEQSAKASATTALTRT